MATSAKDSVVTMVPGAVESADSTLTAGEAHQGVQSSARRGGRRRTTVFEARSFTPAELESKVKVADELYPWMGRLQLEKLYALFDRWDMDCSGSITPKEMKVQMDLYSSLMFDQIDTDGSGQLTWDEMLRLTETLQLTLSEDELREEWEKMNTNHDDSVDRAEFMAWWDMMENGVSMMDLFARFDVGEQDGKISDTEFIAAIALKCESETVDLANLDADQMVRIALEKVRSDVRAIYGTKTAPSVMLHHMRKWRMEEAAGRRCWFSPVSSRSAQFLDYWTVYQAATMAYIAIIIPFRLAGFREDRLFSNTDSAFFWIDVVIDLSFIVDVVFNFRGATRYTDSETGELETNIAKVAKNYMQTWFAVDLVACLPIAYMVRAAGGTPGGWKHLRVVKTLRLFRLSKMLKISELRRLTKRVSMRLNIQGLWTSFRLLTMVLWVMYVAHIVACVWFFLGDDEQVLSDGVTVIYGWRHLLADHHNLAWTDGVTHWSTMYLDCFYFAVTTLTTVGYGDRSAHTDAEKLWVCCIELSGTLIFGVMAGTLTSIISEANDLSLRRDRELEDLQALLATKKVGQELRKEIVLAMDVLHTREDTLVARENEILAQLPPYYRKMCTRDMYHAQIKCCPLFARAGDLVIDRLVQVLKPYLGMVGDEIVSQGRLGDEMFLLSKGQIQILVKDPSHAAASDGQDPFNARVPIYASAMHGMVFCDGAFFGELPVLGLGNGWLRNQHIYSAKALTLAQLCVLRREDLIAVERDNPALKSSIREMAMERAQRFNVPLNRVTLTVEQQRRRISLSLDDQGAIAMVDPDMAEALRLFRLSNDLHHGAVDTAAANDQPHRTTGTDAVLASNVVFKNGTVARLEGDSNASAGLNNDTDNNSGDAFVVGYKASIEAVEKRLDAKLDGVNERLDGMARLLESLAADRSRAPEGIVDVQP